MLGNLNQTVSWKSGNAGLRDATDGQLFPGRLGDSTAGTAYRPETGPGWTNWFSQRIGGDLHGRSRTQEAEVRMTHFVERSVFG